MKFSLGTIQGLIHIGYKRKRNEDRYLIEALEDETVVLLAVADGMGGVAGGDIAAQIVVDTLREYQYPGEDREQDLSGLLLLAGRKIVEKSEAEPEFKDMGTTATVVLLTPRTAYWAHVGDSSLYVLQNKGIEQITTDPWKMIIKQTDTQRFLKKYRQKKKNKKQEQSELNVLVDDTALSHTLQTRNLTSL